MLPQNQHKQLNKRCVGVLKASLLNAIKGNDSLQTSTNFSDRPTFDKHLKLIQKQRTDLATEDQIQKMSQKKQNKLILSKSQMRGYEQRHGPNIPNTCRNQVDERNAHIPNLNTGSISVKTQSPTSITQVHTAREAIISPRELHPGLKIINDRLNSIGRNSQAPFTNIFHNQQQINLNPPMPITTKTQSG